MLLVAATLWAEFIYASVEGKGEGGRGGGREGRREGGKEGERERGREGRWEEGGHKVFYLPGYGSSVVNDMG